MGSAGKNHLAEESLEDEASNRLNSSELTQQEVKRLHGGEEQKHSEVVADDGRSASLAIVYAAFAGVLLLFGLGYLLLGSEPVWYRFGVVLTQWIPIVLIYAPRRRVTGITLISSLGIILALTGFLWWSQRWFPKSADDIGSTLCLMLGLLTAIFTFDCRLAWKGTVPMR
jgi:hypothetical protein